MFDVETTGWGTACDEVVELGMVKVSYHLSGQVASVIDAFSSLNEPTKAIPADVKYRA